MDRKHLLLLPAVAIAGAVLAQGPLTPPGAPAPAMKTLDQIEPRTPISSLPFIVTQPGSYYLTGNLEFTAATGDAITIGGHDVTLDLMGFILSSGFNVTGTGIRIITGRNVEVKNGVIRGFSSVSTDFSPPNTVWFFSPGGFNYGINDTGRNSHFSQLRIFGCRADGLKGGEQALVEQVTAESNGDRGIRLVSGSAINCNASLNYGFGISATSVANSITNENRLDGIIASFGTVTNSTADSNGNNGIFASSGSVTNCSANRNRTGIWALNGCITNSTASTNEVSGISADSGVIAFCSATGNGLADIGSGATRTGNNPTP